VGNSNDGALPASASGKSLELSRQICVLGASGSPRASAGHTTQPWTTFADLAADPLARTHVASGADTGPTGQMRCAWERAAIGSHLSDETPGSHAIHPWDRHPTIQCVREVAVFLSQLIESSV